MFTGIVEGLGRVVSVKKNQENLILDIQSDLCSEIKIDESIAHNGVCLTVVNIDESLESYQVDVIRESLNKSNLGNLEKGDLVNLERAMPINGRLDGHMVQGHIDSTAECISKMDEKGSWRFGFAFDPEFRDLIVEKGSIAINGVSLTIANYYPERSNFEVAIIPYTFEHTTFKTLEVGDKVNIEFDIIGKYVRNSMNAIKKQL